MKFRRFLGVLLALSFLSNTVFFANPDFVGSSQKKSWFSLSAWQAVYLTVSTCITLGALLGQHISFYQQEDKIALARQENPYKKESEKLKRDNELLLFANGKLSQENEWLSFLSDKRGETVRELSKKTIKLERDLDFCRHSAYFICTEIFKRGFWAGMHSKQENYSGAPFNNNFSRPLLQNGLIEQSLRIMGDNDQT